MKSHNPPTSKAASVEPIKIGPEQLAYWYLRLNGFFTIQNFIVHPDRGSNQETDADLLGVRFPYRAENLERPMRDDDQFAEKCAQTTIVIAEVKKGRCKLNGPWTKKDRGNMLRVLRAIGAFPSPEDQLVARALYSEGSYRSQLYEISLLCFGGEANPDLSNSHPKIPQILWTDVLRFVFDRFQAYRKQKSSHQQWDEQGHLLWEASEASSGNADTFCRSIEVSDVSIRPR